MLTDYGQTLMYLAV